MSLRPVLFIAYNFPPHGSAGVQRSLKFTKYLPEFGWQPLIVTTTADASPVQDASLLTDIPSGTPVYRIPGFSITRLQSQAQKYNLDRLVVLLNLLLQVPDATCFWAHKTRKTIDKIIQREKPEAVYTTSGPYSAHLVGLWVKQRFHIPWFADFRDPWSRNLLIPYLPGYRKLNLILERRVLEAADRVACVSEPWLRDLQTNLGTQSEKFIVLTNGYDEADVQSLPKLPANDLFTITHLGSLYRNRRPDNFIQAVEMLIQGRQIQVKDIRILFIGKNTKGIAPDHPPYEAFDYIPHKDLNVVRSQTSVFLLILDTSSENVGNHSGKLFEYIATNRPILGIVPPGGVAQSLIKETCTGITVDDKPSAISEAIHILYSDWKYQNRSWQPNWNLIRQYTRRNLAARLAAEFDLLSGS